MYECCEMITAFLHFPFTSLYETEVFNFGAEDLYCVIGKSAH